MLSARGFASVLGSLLSDLSYSRSEDDLDSTLTRCGKVWKRHRPSLTAEDEAANNKRRRSAVEKTVKVIHCLWGRLQERNMHNYNSYTLTCAVFRMAAAHNSDSTAHNTRQNCNL
jgi:hypothetical protein